MNSKIKRIEKSLVKRVYTKRKPSSRKGEFGKLAIIGGSYVYHGSPALAALAAYRAGCDLVYLIGPRRAMDLAASFAPELITFPLNCDVITKKEIPAILDFLSRKHAFVIGGGMLRTDEVQEAVVELLRKVDLPCVIDADAIYAVAAHKEIVRSNMIITPHSYEFYVLTGRRVEGLETQRKVEMVENAARELGCTILLKGNVDIISNGQDTAMNSTGTPYMTVGGTGDTLAGISGALLARGVEPFISACAAAYINGRAGEIAAKEKGEGLMPTDLIEAIPLVIKGK